MEGHQGWSQYFQKFDLQGLWRHGNSTIVELRNSCPLTVFPGMEQVQDNWKL